MKKIKLYTIFKDQNLSDALKKIHKNGKKCCFVVDKKYRLLGTLSDGDVRRRILNKSNIKKKVLKFCNKKPTYLSQSNYTMLQVKKLFSSYDNIEIIPVVNKEKVIKKVLIKNKIFSLKEKYKIKKQKIKRINTKVVIMAGGRGTRLDPITKILPKPLVPIKKKAVIEHIMERFTKDGIKNFYLTIHHKSEMIKAFFNEKRKSLKINFIEEKKPLGTAGGLRKFYRKAKEDLFVINCDSLIDADLLNILFLHKKKKQDITVVASSQNYKVPYGVCELNGKEELVKINEKPKIQYFVNTGLYLINNQVLKLIPKNKNFQMNDLIQSSINNKCKVGIYKISQKKWRDIGQLEDYKKFINF